MRTASVAARPGERLDSMRWRMSATILIVEDDRNIGNLVRTYLERDGYGVVWVRSGEDGLLPLPPDPEPPPGLTLDHTRRLLLGVGSLILLPGLFLTAGLTMRWARSRG